ncbi:MAG TPA: DUF4388 domain-containing protein [Coleofasciculaceae cyanobacterium]
MCITGSLEDFSLPDIYKLIEEGSQTGLLTVRPCIGSPLSSTSTYYIWFYQGRIVTVANRLNQQGLVSLLAQHQGLENRRLAQLIQSCPLNQPLGTYLKKQGVLDSPQLKSLFQMQVLQPMSTLFQLKEAVFEFNSNVSLPMQEMTGLSLIATEVTLIALRALKNWDALADQLPNPNAGVISTISSHPQRRLNGLEWQVWEYTDGSVSLKEIAKQLRISVKQVQQIVFRLISVGLVEEVPFWGNSLSSPAQETLPEQLLELLEKEYISYSFLEDLAGFLDNQF